KTSVFPAGGLLCPADGLVIITTLRPPEPFVTPFLSLLGAAALVTAPAEPGAAGKAARDQKLTDGLAWKEPADQPARTLQEQLPGYTINFAAVRRVNSDSDSVRILDAGRESYAWPDRGGGAHVVRGDILYRADYSPIGSGCA